MTEQWLSIVEYAKKHDISDMTVRRRIRAGKITAELREGKYFIKSPASSAAAPPLTKADRSSYAATHPQAKPSGPQTDATAPSGVAGSRAEQPRPGAAASQPPQHSSYRSPPRSRQGQPDLPPIPVPYGGDRRKGSRRATDAHPSGGITTDRRTSHYEDDFSYPQLDLAGTRRPSAGVLNEGQSIGVQLTQLEAKIDHLAQPWQQELMASMKSQLDLKDEKISQLQQKIEDLEMIVQMLSSRDKADATPSISLGSSEPSEATSTPLRRGVSSQSPKSHSPNSHSPKSHSPKSQGQGQSGSNLPPPSFTR